MNHELNSVNYELPQVIELDETNSTNTFLRNYRPQHPAAITLATAEFQTAGRGQAGNSWESERGQNLLFSILVEPENLPAQHVFTMSEIIALSIRETVMLHLRAVQEAPPVTVKWPNDIYVADSKIAGILIENDFCGAGVARCIIGCGVNINQTQFTFPTLPAPRPQGTTPTPVSLRQLTGIEWNRQQILTSIVDAFRRRYARLTEATARHNAESISDEKHSAESLCDERHSAESISDAIAAIHAEYKASLYRRQGLHAYRDATGEFLAEIADVEPSGHLLLRDSQGRLRRYAFKEVAYR